MYVCATKSVSNDLMRAELFITTSCVDPEKIVDTCTDD